MKLINWLVWIAMIIIIAWSCYDVAYKSTEKHFRNRKDKFNFVFMSHGKVYERIYTTVEDAENILAWNRDRMDFYTIED